MPYRTAPEKPVEVRVKLTPDEIFEACRNYAEQVKGIKIQENFQPKKIIVHIRAGTENFDPGEVALPLEVAWGEEP